MKFEEYKMEFMKKHNESELSICTSPMDNSGKYVKTYMYDDGATMIEINRPITETVEVEVEVKGIKVVIKKEVELMETEAWNTDNSKSVKFYEVW